MKKSFQAPEGQKENLNKQQDIRVFRFKKTL